jgi:hypothetical protein
MEHLEDYPAAGANSWPQDFAHRNDDRSGLMRFDGPNIQGRRTLLVGLPIRGSNCL